MTNSNSIPAVISPATVTVLALLHSANRERLNAQVSATVRTARALAVEHVDYALSHYSLDCLGEMVESVMTEKPAAFAAEYSATVTRLVDAFNAD